MAGGNSNYVRGSMEVEAQSGAFSGFMGGTKYGGSAIALIVLLPTLIFAVNMTYFPALIATLVLGVLLGLGLKLKGGWYVGIIAAAVLTTLLVGLGALIVSLAA